MLASLPEVLRVPVWIAAGYAILRTNADPDLWGHVRFGLDVLRSHHLPSIDPYSFTSDVAWTNHEWLAEMIMGGAYSAIGTAGLIVIKALVTIATFVVIASSLKRAPELWRWPTALLVVLEILPITLTVRPHLWTLLFLTLECRMLAGAPRLRYWLPLMFVLWVNLHGGWIVGFGVLGVWSLIESFEPAGARPSRWAAAGTLAACALATLCNPYGWHLWDFLAATVRLSRHNITEWQPIWRDSLASVLLWLAGIVWVAVAMRSTERRPLKVVAVIAMLAFASMRVNRLLPLFVPAATILLMPYVTHAGRARRQVWPKGRTILDLAFACVAVLFLAPPASAGCLQMRGSWLPDVAAAAALSAANAQGRVIVWFDWGEYAIWHLGPRLKVSNDGRRETVYSEAVLQEQAAIALGNPTGLRALERSSPEYVWLPVPHSDRTRDWLGNHGYRIDVETPQSFVAVRDDLPRVAPVSVTSTGCFPADRIQ